MHPRCRSTYVAQAFCCRTVYRSERHVFVCGSQPAPHVFDSGLQPVSFYALVYFLVVIVLIPDLAILSAQRQ